MPKYLGTVVYDSDASTWSVEVGLPGEADPPVAGDDIVSGALTVTAVLATKGDDGETRQVGDRARRPDDDDDAKRTRVRRPADVKADAKK